MEQLSGSDLKKRCYTYCKECRAAKTLPMVSSDQFKKVGNLLNSGIDIYHYLKPFKPSNQSGLVIHNSGHKDVAKSLLDKDLCNYRTNCDLCQANLRKIRCILLDISVIKHHEAIGICTHCRENYESAPAAMRCPRCDAVTRKFLSRQVEQFNDAKEKQLREWIERVQELLKSILAACRGKGGRDAEYDELAKLLQSPICSPEALITAFPSIYGIQSEEQVHGSGYSFGSGIGDSEGGYKHDGDSEGGYNHGDPKGGYKHGDSKGGYNHGIEITDKLKTAILRQKNKTATKKLGKGAGAGDTYHKGDDTAEAAKADNWFSPDFLSQVMRHQKTKGKKKDDDGAKKKGRKGRIVCATDQGTINPSSDTISTLQSEGIIIKDEAIDIHSVVSLHVARCRIASRVKRGKQRCKAASQFSKKEMFTNIKESLANFFKPYEDSHSTAMDASKKTHKGEAASPPGDEKALIAKFFKTYLNMDFSSQKPTQPEKSLDKADKPKMEHARDEGDFVYKDSSRQEIDIEKCTGITSYRLSNDYFIRNGWTQLPYMKTLRRIKIYRMIHHKQEFNWFDAHRKQEVIFYQTGEKLAEIGDHYGKWFYRNGKVALQYLTQSTDPSVQRIYQIYSSGEPIRENGKPLPVRLMAAFDYFGNGILYDDKGRIRLQYNQFEGCIEDPDIGTPGKWKWHNLNDPPMLEFEFIDSHCGPNSPFLEELMQMDRSSNVAFDAKMIAIECQNVMKIKMAYRQFNPIMVTMKVLKLNKYISIRLIDQQHIYLVFRDGKTSMKINLGMQLVSNDVVDLVHIDISKFVFLQPREALATGEADLLVQHGPMTVLSDREVNTPPPAQSLKDSVSAAMIEQKSASKISADKHGLIEGTVGTIKIAKVPSVTAEVPKKLAIKPMKRVSVEIPKQKSVISTSKQKSLTKENNNLNKHLDFTLSDLKHSNTSRTKQIGSKRDPLSSSTTKATINTTPKSDSRK